MSTPALALDLDKKLIHRYERCRREKVQRCEHEVDKILPLEDARCQHDTLINSLCGRAQIANGDRRVRQILQELVVASLQLLPRGGILVELAKSRTSLEATLEEVASGYIVVDD